MRPSFIRTVGAAAISAIAFGAVLAGATTFTAAPAEAQGQGNGNGGNGGNGGHGNGGNGNGGNGNGGNGGNGNGKGAERGGGQGAERSARAGSRGAIASELKGANAMNASPQAFANAAPESRVGRLREYRDTALASRDLGRQAAETFAAFDDARDGAVADLGGIDPDGVEGLSQDTLDQAIADLEAGRIGTDAFDDLTEALAGREDYAELAGTLGSLEDLAKAAAEANEAYGEARGDVEDALLAATGGRTLSDAALAELNEALGL